MSTASVTNVLLTVCLTVFLVVINDYEARGELFEEPRQRDSHHGRAGDPGACAEVVAAPEGQVGFLGPVDVVGLGVGERLRVAVGRADDHAEAGAPRHEHALERGVPGRLPWIHADRCDPADRLLERVRPAVACEHTCELVRVRQQAHDVVAIASRGSFSPPPIVILRLARSASSGIGMPVCPASRDSRLASGWRRRYGSSSSIAASTSREDRSAAAHTSGSSA
jgi:hypothetical protein